MNYLFPNTGVSLSPYTIPKHRVGGLCTPLRCGFLSAKKSGQKNWFFGKEKTIHQPPNARLNGYKKIKILY
jgi:hypothetical protein